MARQLIEQYPEVSRVLVQTGRPNDGTDPTGFYNAEIFVSLKAEEDWPLLQDNTGMAKYWRPKRPRTKAELVERMDHELEHAVVGVDWNFSQAIRDNVMEILSGVKGENSIKIFGRDLVELERLSKSVKTELSGNREHNLTALDKMGTFRRLSIRPRP